MAKAFEIRTGLDKLKSWAGMTNKKRISAVVPLQVETLPLRTLSREQCVVIATAFSTVLRLGRLSPLDLSQPAVFISFLGYFDLGQPYGSHASDTRIPG